MYMHNMYMYNMYMYMCAAFGRAEICGSCWAASCPCGYVFDDVADAYTRWPNGRLCCYACA